ncbi:MAG: VanW family protein [Clostridia bacterium]|nr:VanW family protein [Clostridia bacterium]
MRKTHDTTLMVATFILILFAIFLLIFVFQGNNVKDNSATNKIDTNIYTEHTHKVDETNNITNLKKTYEDIGTYTTKIYDKDENRIYNIKLASERLDGHTVAAGEEFSFNNTMGEMGKADGYKKAVGFDSNGKKIKVFGGGMCQISSTLYNAVLASNLEVTERHAHSRRVYYVPKDKDATVFYGGPDFKFKNTSDSNIMICISTDGYTVTVTLKQEKIVEM